MAVIALDIGGTKIIGAELAKDLSIVKSLRVPTQARKGKKHILETIKLVISSLTADTKEKITAIGISLPGLCENGKITYCGNALKSLVGTNLESILKKKFNLPVYIENDANCFTLAESTFGAGHDHDVVLGITWGSGLGGGLVVKDEQGEFLLFQGRQGGALEFGHMPIKHKNKMTTLEKVVGGRFLVTKTKAEPKEIFTLKKHKAVADDAIEHMGQAIATLVNTLNPGIVVLGGGLSNLPKSIYAKLNSKMKKYALKTHTEDLLITKYEITDDAGLFGAGLIALDH